MVEVRLYRPEDKAFVIASFLRGVYYGEFFFNHVPKDVFMENYSRLAETYTSDPRFVIMVAVSKEDPDLIRGYSILSADLQTLHWVFVKAAWRKGGIATLLVPKLVTNITHLTKLGLILRSKLPDAIFNPFAI